MAGYDRHNLRLPVFVKKAFKNMKLFFLDKKHSFLINFRIFAMLNFFDFLPENIIREVRPFLENHVNRYAFYSKFATICHFEKRKSRVFFQFFFSKKIHVLNVLRNLSISFGKFATIW